MTKAAANDDVPTPLTTEFDRLLTATGHLIDAMQEFKDIDRDAFDLLAECGAVEALRAVNQHQRVLSRLMRSAGDGWAHAEVEAHRARNHR